MCLACQMEGEWLAYLEQLAQQELPPKPEVDAVATAKPAAKAAPASPFVCEELPPE